MKLKEGGLEHQVKVEFVWYGTTSKKDKSGAYLFLPDGDATVRYCKRIQVCRSVHFSCLVITSTLMQLIHTRK